MRERVTLTSLVARLEFKRNHFPNIVTKVLDAGNWDSDILQAVETGVSGFGVGMGKTTICVSTQAQATVSHLS